MAKLYLQRHLKSQWNVDDRFAGWTDAPLSKEGSETAKETAEKLKGLPIDVAFTSPLIRNIQTVIKILENLGDRYPFFTHLDVGRMQQWGNFDKVAENCIQVFVSENLNERHYGDLQGLNKAETKKKYGEEQVNQWRTNYTKAPPGGESGKDVYERVVPFFQKYVEKELKAGENVLIVSSHHPLRSIVKFIENIPDDKMGELEIPFAGLIKYDFDGGKYKKLV
jgi:2,3-bisphosphoglycerate-dependent phosphoglycerate mutase